MPHVAESQADPQPSAGDTDRVPSANPWAGVIWVDRERLSGAPCFDQTRVPIKNLWDYLEGGETLEEFLDDFPSVSREQAIAFLEEAGRALLASIA